MFDNVVNLAQKLIQFKTISGNYEKIVQCISFLDSYAKKIIYLYRFLIIKISLLLFYQMKKQGFLM